VNEAVLHQAVVAQLAGRRTGTTRHEDAGEVRGGGKKPYRQKGTGRARQGSRPRPHYSGGGVVFGPHPRSYEQRLNKRMRRVALRSALSAKLADDAIKVVDLFLDAEAEPKTKTFAGTLTALGAGDGHGARSWSWRPMRRAAPALGGEPAQGHRAARGLAQRRGHPRRGHRPHRAARARRISEVYAGSGRGHEADEVTA
jgi:ribosomal protein L4